jgi:lariat debranching enzyme
LGAAGVVKFGNIRIGGLSGIYNHRDYKSGWCMNFVYELELESESLVHVYEKK